MKDFMKIYSSTRNIQIIKTPKEAILAGIADDGGLYVYDGLTDLKLPLEAMMKMNYLEMAETVLSLLLPDFSEAEVKSCVKDAYENQIANADITPVHFAKDQAILE